MKRTTILFFLFIACFISNPVFSQTETKWPKTLLWKISGNGLSKPSYLYGTIHLQDKRVFYFSDSLYHFIEKTDGYAMELDMREFVDSLVQRVVAEKGDELIEDYKKKNRIDKVEIDSLIDNIKNYNDKASRKKLQVLRQERLKGILKSKEMPTIVDAYLYGIARRQGKWLGGIEDVQDQMTLFDELGNEVSGDDLTSSDADLGRNLEKMIQFYLAQDLNGIENYSRSALDEDGIDAILVKRNIKMASRMDSLAHIRSVFFAVGAAHLGGEKGVISLLREKGFTVDPVFSTKKIDPLQYAAKLDNLPWEKVVDGEQTYSVEMPGAPSNLNMFGEIFKMKYYLDITTFTYYMSGSAMAAQSHVDLEQMIKGFSNAGNGEVRNIKKFERDSLRGIEGTMMKDGYYFKVQYMVKGRFIYALLIGSQKLEWIKGDDAKHFFASFKPLYKPVPESGEWKLFTQPDKAFSLMLPGNARKQPAVDKKAEGTNWIFTTYDCVDSASGVYYMFQARDIKGGNYMAGDSIFFHAYLEDIKSIVDTFYEKKIIQWNGFPAYWMRAKVNNSQLYYFCKIINRGNRAYMLLALCNEEKKDDPGIEKFFGSFRFEDYVAVDWKKHNGPGFSTTLPAAIEQKTTEESDSEGVEPESTGEKIEEYYSYNSGSATSYIIVKNHLGPYYWAKNDSVFYETALQAFLGYTDSLVEKKSISNGKVKGREWTIWSSESNLKKKARQFIHGDTLYTLISFIPSQYFNNTEHRAFFEDFRFNEEHLTTTLFQSKAKLLLKDLASSDSVKHSSALTGLSTAEFGKEDMNLLLEALTKDYPYDAGSYSNTLRSIAWKFDDMGDSSMVDGIRKYYLALPKNRETNKWEMLNILSRHKSSYSYELFKYLLLKHTPKSKAQSYLFSYSITDSMQLAARLYPEILQLASDSVFNIDLSEVTGTLLDSNVINVTILQPYKKEFQTMARQAVDVLSDTSSGSKEYRYTGLIKILAAYNDEVSNQLIRKIAMADTGYLNKEAIMALIKNDQVVPSKEIESLVARKLFRREVYESMEELDKLNLFPSKYLNQLSLAEADIYYWASDDYEPSEIKFIAEKTATVDSIQSRFYLFQVIFRDEEGEISASYLGIAGPYSMDKKNFKTNNSWMSIDWDNEFDPKKIEQRFKEWITPKK